MKIKFVALAGVLLVSAFLFSNCAKPASEAVTPVAVAAAQTLPVNLVRISSTQFEVQVLTDALTNFSTSELTLQVTNGVASGWTQPSANVYSNVITTSLTSGEVPMTLTWKNYSATRTALILKTVGSSWDQPEAVPGLVNTFGWEDSPEISPDGKYLIVSTYSPVSLICCLIGTTLNGTAAGSCPGASGNGLAANPSCNTNFFADGLSARPGFPGQSRVLSASAINHSISLLSPPNTTNAFPPVSSYVFEQQADGRFMNPLPLFVDWEAYTWGAPFGFHFKKKIADKRYQVYVAFGDPILANGNKLQSAELDFSQSSLKLGTIARSGGSLVKTNWLMTPLNIPSLSTQAGNPGSSVYGGGSAGYLFWDDESVAQKDLFFATESATSVFGSKQTVGLSQAGSDEYQPFFFQNKLYYSLNHLAIVSQTLAAAANPATAGSWSGFQVDLEVDGAQMSAVGGISAMGEPSLYQDSNGKKWLYFAYNVRSSGGLNLNIGRVRAK